MNFAPVTNYFFVLVKFGSEGIVDELSRSGIVSDRSVNIPPTALLLPVALRIGDSSFKDVRRELFSFPKFPCNAFKLAKSNPFLIVAAAERNPIITPQPIGI